MRYFYVSESEGRAQGRRWFSLGVSAHLLSQVLEFFFPAAAVWFLPLSLASMGILYFSCVMWDRAHTRRAGFFCLLAIVLRIGYAVWAPSGLFSFLLLLPASAAVLIGELLFLEKLQAFYRERVSSSEQKRFAKAVVALPRAEVSYWLAMLLSYITDLLVLPAVTLFFWSVGVRIWLSALTFRGPKPIPSRLFFEKRTARIQ